MQTTAYEAITALAQAAGGGLLVAAFAWFVCRYLPKLTAPVRFALWWLVGAKFLLGLVFAGLGVTALRVEVMRAEHYRTLRGLARQTVAGAGRVVPVAAQPVVITALSPPKRLSVSVVNPASPLVSAAPGITLSEMRRVADAGFAVACVPLAGLYSAGVLLCLWRTAHGARRLRRMVRGTDRCENAATLADVAFVAARTRLHTPPAITVSLQTSVPFVVGAWRPVIVLPAAFLAETSANRRMALAHEMAHVRRGDLFLETVPLLLRTLFWFLPGAGFVANEIASAREECCDSVAVQVCEASPPEYAALLVRVAEQAGASVPAMAMARGKSPGFHEVKRRLRTLSRETHGEPISLFWRGVALTLVTAQAAATLLPLRPALARAAEAARAALPKPSVPMYTLTDLGTLGGKHSGAFGINDAGQVAGVAQVFPLGARGHAFLWSGNGLRDLTAGSVYRHSQAVAVAENGFVAGYAFRSSYRSGAQNAFVWNGARRVYLPPARGYKYAKTTAISDAGAVVGASLGGGTDAYGAVVARATLWQNNRVRNLGTLGGAHSMALGINRDGVVVGKADLTEYISGGRVTHPFMWSAATGTMRDLGTLGDNNTSGAATGVSDAGLAVGYAQTTAGTVHAFAMWVNSDSKPRDLGTLPGYSASVAYATSETGVIAGQATGAGQPTRAVLWASPTAEPMDLNERLLPDAASAGWHLETVRGVNSGGQLVGQGTVNGARHAFLLTPAP